MFDILVYLYETYYRPDACPEPAALARKLSAVGFDDVEISEALVWLTDLTEMAGGDLDCRVFLDRHPLLRRPGIRRARHAPRSASSSSSKAPGVLSPVQREIVIERALALDESPGRPRQAEDHRADAALEPGQGAGRADVRRPVRFRRRAGAAPAALTPLHGATAVLPLSHRCIVHASPGGWHQWPLADFTATRLSLAALIRLLQIRYRN